MSSFDTISRWKKQSTNSAEKSEEILKKNTNKKAYKDIHKNREKIITVKPKKFFHQPKIRTGEEKIFRLQDTIRKIWNSLKKRQIGIMVLVFFLSLIVYGVWFVLRTEKTVKNVITSPEQYYSIKK